MKESSWHVLKIFFNLPTVRASAPPLSLNLNNRMMMMFFSSSSLAHLSPTNLTISAQRKAVHIQPELLNPDLLSLMELFLFKWLL